MIHTPVMRDTVLQQVIQNPNGLYLDGTFGYGGHAYAAVDTLADAGKIIGIDKDNIAVETHTQTCKQNAVLEKHVSVHKADFADFDVVLEEIGITALDGAWFDLGLNSQQIDTPERGFTFQYAAPLDMRMNQMQSLSAKTWLASASVAEMTNIFRTYGEEKFAKRIAIAIDAYRQTQPIETTNQLVDIIRQAQPFVDRHKHPATRVFQAIRIFINNELQSLEQMLEKIITWLKPQARLAILSFHSLEDRIVKRFFQKHSKAADIPVELPIEHWPQDQMPVLRIIGRFFPSDSEIATNRRARSAVLRVVEKI